MMEATEFVVGLKMFAWFALVNFIKGLIWAVGIFTLTGIGELLVAAWYRKKHEEAQIETWSELFKKWSRKYAFWAVFIGIGVAAPFQQYRAVKLIATTPVTNSVAYKAVAFERDQKVKDIVGLQGVVSNLLQSNSMLSAIMSTNPPGCLEEMKDLEARLAEIRSNTNQSGTSGELRAQIQVSHAQEASDMRLAVATQQRIKDAYITIKPQYHLWVYTVQEFYSNLVKMAESMNITLEIPSIPSLDYLCNNTWTKNVIVLSTQSKAVVEYHPTKLYLSCDGKDGYNSLTTVQAQQDELVVVCQTRRTTSSDKTTIYEERTPLSDSGGCGENIKIAIGIQLTNRNALFPPEK